MISEDNIRYLEEKEYEYILGVKMRQLSKIRQKILLNDDGFLAISSSLKAKEMQEEKKKTKILAQKQKDDYKNSKKGQRRWITCLNPVMAEIDQKKREYFRQIIEKKVEFSTAKEWIVKNGYKKYVTIKDMKIELNREKFKEDEIYDGKWALITNTNFSKNKLVDTYKDLAMIERHFRDLKSELEIGPVYHYTEKRIRAHIFVCFLALQLKVALTKKLKELDENLSYSEVMRDVARIKAVKYKTKGEEITIRTELAQKARLAFNAIGANIPSKIVR
jgi:transposase